MSTITAGGIYVAPVVERPKPPEYPLLDPAYPSRFGARDRRGRELTAVVLHLPPDVDEHEWRQSWPAGNHLYTPGSHEPNCYCRSDNGYGYSWGWGEHPFVLVRQFDWLFWTQREHTDEAVFLDHWLGHLWRVRRTLPDAPSTFEPRFVGYHVGPEVTR